MNGIAVAARRSPTPPSIGTWAEGSHARHVAEAILAARAGEQAAATETLRELSEKVERLADSIEGDEGVAHNYGCEGEPTCFACIVADLRALLAATGTDDNPRNGRQEGVT